MYDIFFVSQNDVKSNKKWKSLKQSYPLAKKIDSSDTDKILSKIAKKSFTKFFWIVFSDLNIDRDFDFSYQPDEYSQDKVHVFLNGQNFDGVCLIPKKFQPSEKEFANRFFINKKEVNIQASIPQKLDKFYIDTYDEYLQCLTKTNSEFFWIIPNNLDLTYNFTFDFFPNYWDKTTHVFLNGKYYDGVSLHNKKSPVTKKEFEYRFYTNKKEIDITASNPKKYDIVFISYNEPNASENYKMLKSRFPYSKNVHGVEGIHNAHVEAAKVADTNMFWAVDGDAVIKENFLFDYQVPYWDEDTVHVWRSVNPVNNLSYGYGGVKLLPKKKTLEMDLNKTDMTTSISNKFKVVDQVSNITAFNTDSFSAWKSGFRECAKLASRSIDRQNDKETKERLDTWCNVGTNSNFGIDVIRGAKEGRKFGEENKDNSEELSKINDFDWLYERFSKNSV